MIPYPELASALERWRMRNGLPTTVAAPPPIARPLIPQTSPPPSAPPAAVVAPPSFAPPVATPPPAASPPPAAAPPRSAPPAPPGRTTVFGVPPPPAAVIAAAAAANRPPTNLPEDEHLLDADVIDEHHEVAEDEYENEGNDFAVTFGGPPKAASGSIGGAGADDAIATSPHAPLEDPFGAPTAAVPSGAWPEVAEAREWPPEQTNATAFGWGQGYRPPTQAGDEEDSTIVGGGKPKG